jgi:RNA polymerase sigma-70 factor (ECF subfamily)
MKIENPTSTFGLISRIQSGDREAFSALFEKYRRRISLFLYYKVGDHIRRQISIQELIQETFLRAYRDFDRFQYLGPGSFMNWLSTIADRVVADRSRLQNRKKRKAVDILRFRSDTNPQGPEPIVSLTPSRIFEGQEKLERLQKILDSLPEDYRRVIIQSRIEGCLTEEIARQMGRSRQNVSLLLHRALKRFRELYEKENS